ALLWCVPACGSKDTKDGDKGGSGDPKGDLIQLVQAYQSYSSGAKGNGPPSAEAWAKWARGDQMHEVFVPLIDECKPGGRYVFYWNVRQPGVNPPKIVLGHERDAATKGGWVLFLNADVEKVSAEEFARAAKPSNTQGELIGLARAYRAYCNKPDETGPPSAE